MKRSLFLFLLFSSFNAFSQTAEQLDSSRHMLPNGWSLSPAGRSLALGDLPLNAAFSKSGKYLAVTNNGQGTQSIQLFNARKEVLLDEKQIPKSWYGLKFSADEKFLYASGGNDNCILRYSIENDSLKVSGSIPLGESMKKKISPAGIDIDDERMLMYVVSKENNSVYIVDLKKSSVIHRTSLEAEAYNCVLSPAKDNLYITCWGCDKVLVLDTKNFAVKSEIKTGNHPNEIITDRSGNYLYVANANDNSVSVIDTRNQNVIGVLDASLYPGSPPGSTTNGLALSDDGKTLFIANADNNCLAVFDVTRPAETHSKGFIPVGWYPTCVRVSGKKIFVTNGKGLASQANPYGPDPVRRGQTVIYEHGDTSKPVGVQYIASLFKGSLSIIPIPGEKQLDIYSQAVYKNTPYSKVKEEKADGEKGNPIPMTKGEQSPIKYVFYIIKENRTYDQVLGDEKNGNGDTSLVLFGKNITPNQHHLAEQFVLLDNFYVDAEVSADGHNWSMGAYATDYLEKTWPTYYGGRGGDYNGEGTKAIANNKNGFIWDLCKRNHVSYRTYGEFADNGIPNIPSLTGNTCVDYTGFDLSVKDVTRYEQWQQDFDALVQAGRLPSFNTIRLGNDHTQGLRKNKLTPFAYLADNDLAVGRFIEHLSQSPIWKESAVFILEDDAQNGADHVDAHRSTAYLAGGFVKRNYTDHTMYSTSSMLRTMELILGLPPMTQYDAAAEPMWRCFTHSADISAFNAVVPDVNMNEKNLAVNQWQRRSEKFNFKREDAAPDRAFGEVIWYAVKGANVPFPAERHAAFVKERKEDD